VEAASRKNKQQSLGILSFHSRGLSDSLPKLCLSENPIKKPSGNDRRLLK